LRKSPPSINPYLLKINTGFFYNRNSTGIIVYHKVPVIETSIERKEAEMLVKKATVVCAYKDIIFQANDEYYELSPK